MPPLTEDQREKCCRFYETVRTAIGKRKASWMIWLFNIRCGATSRSVLNSMSVAPQRSGASCMSSNGSARRVFVLYVRGGAARSAGQNWIRLDR